MSDTARTALRELTALAGLHPATGDEVAFTSDDPVFPTPYRIGASAAAAIAATGLASSTLWALRTGRTQSVGIDLQAAAASLRGHKYLKVNGVNPQTRESITRFYQLADGGWIYLHCNFPHLRQRNLGFLRAKADPQSVAAAVRSWTGTELEDAIFDAGGCGGLVRTRKEWAEHPQGCAVARLPVLELIRIGDAPSERLPAGDRPLSGIRVLDLTRVIAGPFATRVLAEHGADVLKISRPDLPDSGALDVETGIGKLSAYLDLRDPRQADRLRELVRTSHVFAQAYRPGTLAARGFGPHDLAAMRPGIVYVTLSAWGHEGPWQARRGYDTVVQAVNGMADTSSSESEPRQLPVAAIDYVAGNLMAFGTMAALARRATEGGSWMVRVSLAAVGHWITKRGLLDSATYASAPTELSAARLSRLMHEIDAPVGRVSYLAPVLELSETPPLASRPPVQLGHSMPQWPLEGSSANA